MPNILNQRMIREIEGFLGEASDSVVIDFEGMSVADAEQLRRQLREAHIRMRVLKTSLARRAAKELGFDGAEEILVGPTAICWGGESVADVARVVRDFAKARPSPKVKGGFLEKKKIGPEQVEALASLPSRKELLAQVLGTIVAPMTQTLGAIEALLSSPARLAKALEDKRSEEGSAGS